MEEIEVLNRSLFLAINGHDGSSRWVVNLALVIGDLLIYLIPALLLWMWLWGSRAQREMSLKTFVVCMLAVGVNQIIPIFYQHPRPFELGLGHTWLTHSPDSSFPSDHVTVFCSAGLCLLFGRETILGAVAISAGALVAWARIFLGIHFPMDMLGAIFVAFAALAIASPLWRLAGQELLSRAHWIYRGVFAKPISYRWVRP